jgi:DNA-binding winged helix-turn-helix (wHTH) protein/Tol biopolymer transport system component
VRDQESSPSVAFHPTAGRRAVLFGPFRFDLSDKTLTRDGEEIRLPPRALLILAYLLERPNRVVGKQDLIDAVWKDAFVGESSLTEAMGVLRQALGDSASDPGYIQTVHRRGYRFVAPLRVEAQAASTLAPAVSNETQMANTAPSRAQPKAVPWFAVPASAILVALAALVALGGAGVWIARRNEPAREITRATVTLPSAQSPAPGLTAQPVAALSPDGRRIVYVAGAPGNYRLFLRAIDQFNAIPISGTDGAHGAFFSPDGSSIGYFARGRLFVLRLPDGQPIDLAASGAGHGGWWHTDDSIIFATGSGQGLFRIAARGGTPDAVEVQGIDPAMLRHPTLLDDGRTLLATHWKFNVRHSEIVAIDAGTGSVRTVARGVHARALSANQIAYLRDGDLVAAPVSGAGPEVTLISGVMTGLTAAGQYSLAVNGTLLYLADIPERLVRRMAAVSHDGVAQPLLFEPRPFQNVALSPDGRFVAVTIYERGASDLWVGDTTRGVFQRLTSDGGNVDPVWSRDGRTIFFGSTRLGRARIHRVPAEGGAATIVSPSTSLSPSSTTADGVLFATRFDTGGGGDIVTLASDGTVRDWLATPAAESGGRVSPDDRHVVYRSNRSGRIEVYLRATAGNGPERQVSVGGGTLPGWSADGRFIFFFNGRGIYRVEFRDGELSRPEKIYENERLVFGRAGERRLIVLEAIEEEKPLTTINLVIGWTDEVRSRMRSAAR